MRRVAAAVQKVVSHVNIACPSLLAAMRGQASQQTLRRNFWQRRRILAVITFWDESDAWSC